MKGRESEAVQTQAINRTKLHGNDANIKTENKAAEKAAAGKDFSRRLKVQTNRVTREKR